jgi:hypothetical protein
MRQERAEEVGGGGVVIGGRRPIGSGGHRHAVRVCKASTRIGRGGFTDMWAPCNSPRLYGSNGFEPDSNFRRIQISSKPSKVWMIKKGHSLAQKMSNKYDCEDFEERNKSLHRNVSRFKMNFKWKF